MTRGLIRTGGLFQILGLHGVLFEYGLIGIWGLNEDLWYWNLLMKVLQICLKTLHFILNFVNNPSLLTKNTATFSLQFILWGSREVPYRTKLPRTKFSSDKIFRRTKFSSPIQIFVTFVRQKVLSI